MKNLIILIIIVAIAAGLWFVSQNKSPTAPSEEKSAASTESKEVKSPSPQSTLKPLPEPTPPAIIPPAPAPAPSQESKPLTLNATVIAGEKTKLYEFNQKDYETAAASGKLVVLYYFANWCPICTKEFADAKSVFSELENANVVGFRVNFNDSDTEDGEKELAQKHGVAYQHTKVFVKNGERILKSPEGWSKERYVKEISAAL